MITVTSPQPIRGPVAVANKRAVVTITRLTAHLRWSDLINLLLHTGQMKFFSPV